MEFQAENEQDGNKPVTSKITAYDTQTFQTYHGRIYFDDYRLFRRSYINGTVTLIYWYVEKYVVEKYYITSFDKSMCTSHQ